MDLEAEVGLLLGGTEAEGSEQNVPKANSSHSQERQLQISRLATAYREESKQLMKELLKQQTSWHNELQASGVLVGLPSLQQPRGHGVRRRLVWRSAEREALKRHLLAHGVGKWKEIHASLCNSLRGFKHGPGDVEDASWQLLGELQLLLTSPEERLCLARIMESVPDKGPVYTPGPPYSKLASSAPSIVRRLRLLEEFNMLLPALLRSEAVAGYFRALAAALPAADAPAPWWDVEADVGLLVGLHKHGFNNFEGIRQDCDLAAAFQGQHPPSSQQQCSGPETAHRSAADTTADPQDQSWPAIPVLTQRVKHLLSCLAEAVSTAESQGLLLPTGGDTTIAAGSDRLLGLTHCPQGGAGFLADGLWREEDDALLDGPMGKESDEESDEEGSSDEGGAYGMGAYHAPAYGRGGRGRGRRGRGRGRGITKAERLAAEAAAFTASAAAGTDSGDAGDEPGLGRRRVHRPNSRYADHVLLTSTAEQAAAGAGSSFLHVDASGHHDVNKKSRKDLLAVLFTWGTPANKEPPAGPGGGAAAAAGSTGAGSAAPQEYDWDSWQGRADFTASLQKASHADLTNMMKELFTEMEDLLAATSGAKPRNTHTPTCDCIVCINRRRAEERRQKDAEVAAAGGDTAAGDVGMTAAAGGAGEQTAHTGAADAAAHAGDVVPEAKHVPVKAEVLTAVTAGRLQERLELMSTFKAALQQLPRGWHLQGFKRGAKDLPAWWLPQHDLGLVQGVLKHGFGNWTAMCEDDTLPFKAAAKQAGYVVDASDPAAPAAAAVIKGGKGKVSGAQPDWVPDPKALAKRCKSLVTSIRKSLTKPSNQAPPPVHRQQASVPAGFTAAAGRAMPQVLRGPAPGIHLHQQQQLLALPPNPEAAAALQQLVQRFGHGPALMQALQAAAAQGNAQLGLEYMRQQQHAQQLLLQQQQQQAAASSVLGKRTSSSAGLPEGGSSAHAVPGAQAFSAQAGTAAAAAAEAAGPQRRSSAGDAAPGAAAGPGQAGGLSESQVALLRSLPVVKRDASGAPVLPLVLSRELMVIALGRIESVEPTFHTSSYIFPIGYTATCSYPSMMAVGSHTRYTTVVAEGSGGQSALFVVVAADAPGKQWVATSPADVWQQVQAQVQAVQQVQLPPVDGVTQMGLTNPLVSMLIQELPGADACQHFKPDHSPAPRAVVAAIKQWQQLVVQQQQQQPATQSQAAQLQRVMQQMQQQHHQQQTGLAATSAAAAAAAGGGGGDRGGSQPPAAPAATAILQQQLAAAAPSTAQQQAAMSQLMQQQALRLAQQGGQPAATSQQQMLQVLQQRQALQHQQQQALQQGLGLAQLQQLSQQQQQQLLQRLSVVQQQRAQQQQQQQQ